MLTGAMVGGRWAGWSCAYSVYGEPLPLPPDLCPTTVSYGFQECSSERLWQLQEPATGNFVERETAKLLPDPDVQVRTGKLTQVFAVGDGLVQDSHYEDDVWVLQTVLPGADANQRKRVGLLFDHARGQVVQGIRVWQEQRPLTEEVERDAEAPLSKRSRDELAAEWMAATGDVDCFADADTPAPPLSVWTVLDA